MYTDTKVAEILKTEPVTRDRIGEPEPFSKSRKRRDISSTWEIGPGQEWPNETRPGKPGTIRLTLNTYHHGDRKEYQSTLRVELASENWVQTTMAFGARGEAVRVSTSECARFSAKTMREHHARAVELVGFSALNCAQHLREGIAQYVKQEVAAS